MSRFAKHLDTVIKVAGEDIVLKLQVKDRLRIAHIIEKQKDDKYEQLHEIFVKGIKAASPEEDEKIISEFVAKYIVQFFLELSIDLGFVTRDAVETKMSNVKKKMEEQDSKDSENE